MFKNLKIRNKIMVIFAVVGLIPMIVIALFAGIQSRGALIDQIYEELELYQEMTERRIEEYMEEKLTFGWVLSQTTRITDAVEVYNTYGVNSQQWQEAYQELEEFLPGYADEFEFLGIYIIDNNGRGIYGSGQYKELIEGADYSVRDYFRESIRGNQNISEFEYSDIINDYYISIATPLRNNQNEIIGTVNAYIPIPTIQNLVQEGIYLIGETGDVYLVNANGLLYTNTLRGRFSQNAAFRERINTQAYQDMASHIANGNDDFVGAALYDDYDGYAVIGAYGVMNIGDTNLGLIVEIDQDEGLAAVNTLIMYILLITIITLIIAVVLIIFASKTITSPVQLIRNILDKLAAKDFTVYADYQSKDEIGEVAKNLNKTIKDLNNALSRVNQSSSTVANGTDEIATGNQDLSQRTQEQASSVEEISSTIEEVSSSINQVANSSQEGDKLANQTLQIVQEGQEAVESTKQAMANITASSEKIANIISAVNDIAFQTNLLALNAAVEAARAGEQGRGFAVVAAEVRNLAGRTAESSSEIEKLISDNVELIKTGNERVERSGKILEEIVKNTSGTNDVVGEIAAAMREQATASDQIRSTLDNLNQVTQQNASMVEEIASTSESMSTEAQDLQKLVRTFKLSSNNNEQRKTKKKAVKPSRNNDKKAFNNNNNEEDFDINMDEFEKF